MLAKSGNPFDSARHLYEVKWDGIRAVTLVEHDSYRILSRAGNDLTRRYPELAVVSRLPAGTVLDGEIVVLEDGRPNFELALRHRARSSAQATPAAPPQYVVFDLLYRAFQSSMEQPLLERRAPLPELVGSCRSDLVTTSDGFVGAGIRFYREMCARGLEGVVAKRLDSRYLPGKRSDAWIKMKRRIHLNCVVLGYLDKEGEDFQSLIVATDRGEGLRYAGRVGTGFTAAQRREIKAMLRRLHRERPLLPPPDEPGLRQLLAPALWVEPELFCVVSCLELTSAGIMRAPVFEGLVAEGAQ